MASRIDPAIAQMFAENVRAKVLVSPPPTPAPVSPPPAPALPTLKLDPQIVKKIAEKVPVFSGMPHHCLLSTLGRADHVPLKAGEPVFNEGDVGSAFFVVIAGEVAVKKNRNGESVEVARMTTGHCFGEMALVRNDIRTATVVAVRDSVAMRFEREQVDSDAESAHVIYRNIARILAGRLQESSGLLADMTIQQKDRGASTPA